MPPENHHFRRNDNPMHSMKLNTILGLAALVGAGCAGAPPASLADARSAYQRASTGPAAELAPAQLHAAEVFLKTAEQTYADEGNSPNMGDRAYVAMRKAELAEAHAAIIQANLQVKKAQDRGEMAEQSAHAATAAELSNARAELQSQRGLVATRGVELQAERERREQAEQAQQQALAALSRVENVKQEPRGTVITLSGSVIFQSGKAELLPAARNKLSEVATALAQGDAASKIVVEGHTDSVGSETMNQTLSMRRAEAVRDALVSSGVGSERVTVQGYGASRPVADNESPAGRANNRRVEIVVAPSA
jgi:outer membrane protein OmpA-like peptidoglycan-associated protein